MIAIKSKKTQLTTLLGLEDGVVDGPMVGLDDGCSEDREQEISCVSKCDSKAKR